MPITCSLSVYVLSVWPIVATQVVVLILRKAKSSRKLSKYHTLGSQWLRAWLLFQRMGFNSQHPHGSSQLSLSKIPGVWLTQTYVQAKHHAHKIKINKNKCASSSPPCDAQLEYHRVSYMFEILSLPGSPVNPGKVLMVEPQTLVFICRPSEQNGSPTLCIVSMWTQFSGW